MIALVDIKLPPRLMPIRSMLAKAADGDEEARAVVDDWFEEQSFNAAEALWLATKPTKFQRSITLAVIGKGASVEYFSDPRRWAWEAIAEAQRQLSIHRHTMWIRVIKEFAQTGPVERIDEAIMDLNGAQVRRQPPGSIAKANHVGFRTRCKHLGCVHTSYATQPVCFERADR